MCGDNQPHLQAIYGDQLIWLQSLDCGKKLSTAEYMQTLHKKNPLVASLALDQAVRLQH